MTSLLTSLRPKLFIYLWLNQRRRLPPHTTTLNVQAWRTGTDVERSNVAVHAVARWRFTMMVKMVVVEYPVVCLTFSSSPSLKESWTLIYTALRFQVRQVALTHWASWPVCDLATCWPAVQFCRCLNSYILMTRRGMTSRQRAFFRAEQTKKNTVGLLDPENELRCFETSVTVY